MTTTQVRAERSTEEIAHILCGCELCSMTAARRREFVKEYGRETICNQRTRIAAELLRQRLEEAKWLYCNKVDWTAHIADLERQLAEAERK